MEEFIAKLKEKFEKTIPEEEKELVKGFEEYLHFTVNTLKESEEPFIKKDEASIQRTLSYITNSLMESDLDVKKQKLLKDEKMETIQRISNRSYQNALKIWNGEILEEEVDIEKQKEDLKEALKGVASYNQVEAKRLVSEGLLDLNYMEDPSADIVSLRLGREIRAKKMRESRSHENEAEK